MLNSACSASSFNTSCRLIGIRMVIIRSGSAAFPLDWSADRMAAIISRISACSSVLMNR